MREELLVDARIYYHGWDREDEIMSVPYFLAVGDMLRGIGGVDAYKIIKRVYDVSTERLILYVE